VSREGAEGQEGALFPRHPACARVFMAKQTRNHTTKHAPMPRCASSPQHRHVAHHMRAVWCGWGEVSIGRRVRGRGTARASPGRLAAPRTLSALW